MIPRIPFQSILMTFFPLLMGIGQLTVVGAVRRIDLMRDTDTPAFKRIVNDINKYQSETNDTNYLVPVDLRNYLNSMYYTQLNIGTPSQNFSVLVDTGSSVVWVPDATIRSTGFNGKSKFFSGRSRTYRDLRKSVALTYLTATGHGSAGTDQITLGGIPVQNHTFIRAESMAIPYTKYDGVVGFSPSSETLFNAMVEQRQLTDPVFSIWLNDEANKSQPGGHLFLDGYDETFINGSITYAPLAREDQAWTVGLDGLKINGKSVSTDNKKLARLDSGSSMILAPRTFVDTIHELMGASTKPGQAYWTLNCSMVKSVPDIAFRIRGRDFVMTGEDMVMRSEEVPELCMSVFIPRNTRDNILLGEPFLRKYFSIYDIKTRRVGLALARNPYDKPQRTIQVKPQPTTQQRSRFAAPEWIQRVVGQSRNQAQPVPPQTRPVQQVVRPVSESTSQQATSQTTQQHPIRCVRIRKARKNL